ncbi:MAG: AAA family ATPase [Vicinamibacterales bacterium]
MDDQARVIAFLSEPRHHGLAEPVERVETHSAIVLLAGGLAYKLKRAVRYDYLDFSTLERRRLACEAEVALNRRTAPDLYLGVVPVTEGPGGALALDGPGRAVEWLVVMRRFDQDALFDRLAANGRLPLPLMPALATAVARLHAAAAVRPDHGGVAGMAWVIDGNAADFDPQPGDWPAGLPRAVTLAARAALDRHADTLERRRAAGHVRQCHGDLHLRNIVLLDGRPVLFDGIEFNDRIACVDVVYDLAFLLMDLLRRELPAHASAVFNHYFAVADEDEGLALLPLFLSCRAAVRAKTSAAAARLQPEPAAAQASWRLAHAYLRQAAALLEPRPVTVIAIGGLSGAGKSTLAARLAPALGVAPGALVLRSDVVRKHLLGAALEDRLGPDGYTAAVTRRVYAALAARARAAAAAGHSVIVDAVFAAPDTRAAVAAAAAGAGVRFTGLWLEAPAHTLRTRLAARVGDVSDATPEVLEGQHRRGTLAWHLVDAVGDPAATERHAREVLDRG